MRLVGWLAIAVAVVAGLVWAGWTWALDRPEMGLRLYERAISTEQASAAALKGDPAAMRAIACGRGSCVLVEAGGLSFLFGAGAGSAEYLSRQGYLTRGIDLVLLNDLSSDQVEEMAPLRRQSWLEGRRAPLQVVGPAGVGAVVDGVNLAQAMADRLDGQRFGQLRLDPAAANLTPGPVLTGERPQRVFDTGVVAIEAFPLGQGAVAERVLYRVDVGGRSIIVAPCGVTERDVVAAAIGADRTALVIPAVNEGLQDIRTRAMTGAGRTRAATLETGGAAGCPGLEEALSMAKAGRASAALLSPVYPAPGSEADERAARGAATLAEAAGANLGLQGRWVELTPQVEAQQP
jgi:hypothetical protein